MTDPNPKVNGKGLKILEEAGIKTALLTEFEPEAKFLNKGFVFVHKYGRPFITLKAAMSLDGKMCLSNGSSKWLTGLEARTEAHRVRAENDAVLVGAGTVLADDPELTVRHVEGVNPLRVVLDAALRTPLGAKVLGTDGKCLILTSEDSDSLKAQRLRDSGAEVHTLPCTGGRINLEEAVRYLAGRGVLTLMVEGGPEVLGGFLREGLADYVKFFVSPRILGEGKSITVNSGFGTVNEAFRLEGMKPSSFGQDILLEGRLTCSPDL